MPELVERDPAVIVGPDLEGFDAAIDAVTDPAVQAALEALLAALGGS